MLTVSVAGLALVLSAAAASGVIRADRGVVRAKVSFVKSGYEYRRLRLRITRERRTWVSALLGVTYYRPPKLFVRDLDADGEPEVGFDTYTGGAHCCDESRFFRYVLADTRYRATYHSWGDATYRLRDLGADGRPELVSADARFAYAFTFFAASFFPVQIWHFDHGRLLDVTRSFQAQVRYDSDKLWRTYVKFRRTGYDVRGVLAAWMADQYLLGREQAGWLALEAAKQRGELDAEEDQIWPSGARYLRALRAYLVKLGYAVR